MFCRWLSMIMCGLVAAAIWLPIAPLLEPLLSPVHRRLGALPREVLLISVAMTAIAVCWPFGRGRWRACFGLRHFFQYPPLWVAMASGVIALTGGSCLTQGSNAVSECLATLWWAIDTKPIWHAWPWGVIFAACMACHYFDPEVREARVKHKERRKDRKNSAQTADTDSTRNRLEELANKPVEQIIEWLKDDKEVTHPDNDYFGHDDVARRIASRLKQDPTPSIAVIGEKGSGKSTIYKLTEHRIENDRAAKHILMVRISLWPYQSPEAAVNGIISELIRKLSTRVNTLALAGLGEQYANSIQHLGGFWATMARLACRDPSPERTLKALDRVASAIGVKLILWIEDLERFANAGQLTSEEAKSAEAERLSPIRALLHLLDRCDRLSVIVADTSLDSRFDVGKIARHTEYPPQISIQVAWEIIQKIRVKHLKMLKDAGYIEPALARREFYNQIAPTYSDAYRIAPDAAVAILTREPRNLKTALRLANSSWEVIFGEIDLDENIMASTLRGACPSMFSFLVSNRHIVAPHFASILPSNLPETDIVNVVTPEDLVKQFNQQLETITDPYRRLAASSIAKFLFPSLRGRTSKDYDPASPQGIFCTIGCNIFERYLSLQRTQSGLACNSDPPNCPLSKAANDQPESLSDQEILKVINCNITCRHQLPKKGTARERFANYIKNIDPQNDKTQS